MVYGNIKKIIISLSLLNDSLKQLNISNVGTDFTSAAPPRCGAKDSGVLSLINFRHFFKIILKQYITNVSSSSFNAFKANFLSKKCHL